MNVPHHVTDLTRGDFEEIARATNPKPGIGIAIEKRPDSFEFSINETQFKWMMWAFYHNGGFQASADDVASVPLT